MTTAFIVDMPHSAEAHRTLQLHEEVAVSVIYSAYQLAKQRGDRESVDEVVRYGCYLQGPLGGLPPGEL